MASSEENRLKLTDAQEKDLPALQKTVDERFDKLRNATQRKQLKSVYLVTSPPEYLFAQQPAQHMAIRGIGRDPGKCRRRASLPDA